MSHFYSKFLVEDAPHAANGDASEIYLAAFGKHPGWDDHIEDIGMATQSLILAKQLLYIQGIGGQIDAGSWDKLPAGQELPQFQHLFVWQRYGRFLLGSLWSSSDGKGRTRYPMVVCAQGIGLPLEWAVSQLLPELERIQHACAATRLAGEVQTIMAQASKSLRQRMAMIPAMGAGKDASDRDRFDHRPEWRADCESFLRVVHQFRQQSDTYRDACRLGGHDLSQVKSQQIRAPLAGDCAGEAILMWEQFVYLQVTADTPVLFVVPAGAAWMDITIGEPDAEDFFCLKASENALPLASNIPYVLEPDIKPRAEQILAAMRRGEKPWRAVPAPSSAATMGGRFSAMLSEKAHKLMRMARGGE